MKVEITCRECGHVWVVSLTEGRIRFGAEQGLWLVVTCPDCEVDGVMSYHGLAEQLGELTDLTITTQAGSSTSASVT